jgi:hypothetical protein
MIIDQALDELEIVLGEKKASMTVAEYMDLEDKCMEVVQWVESVRTFGLVDHRLMTNKVAELINN